jgi:hypothetical protein
VTMMRTATQCAGGVATPGLAFISNDMPCTSNACVIAVTSL